MHLELKKHLVDKFKLESIDQEDMDLVVKIRFKEYGEMINFLEHSIK